MTWSHVPEETGEAATTLPLHFFALHPLEPGQLTLSIDPIPMAFALAAAEVASGFAFSMPLVAGSNPSPTAPGSWVGPSFRLSASLLLKAFRVLCMRVLSWHTSGWRASTASLSACTFLCTFVDIARAVSGSLGLPRFPCLLGLFLWLFFFLALSSPVVTTPLSLSSCFTTSFLLVQRETAESIRASWSPWRRLITSFSPSPLLCRSPHTSLGAMPRQPHLPSHCCSSLVQSVRCHQSRAPCSWAMLSVARILFSLRHTIFGSPRHSLRTCSTVSGASPHMMHVPLRSMMGAPPPMGVYLSAVSPVGTAPVYIRFAIFE
jgi:hypothetical protein